MKQLAPQLLEAGVQALNISVDSLDPERFARITGMDRLGEVLEGIEEALALGFASVKVNAVLLKDWNEADLDTFLEWIRTRPISVRFIELMPTGQTRALFNERHVRADSIQAKLLASGWEPRARGDADGPAKELSHPDYLGRIGLIAPYSTDFCQSCNRLRVTSRGELRLCLFGEGNSTLRPLIQRSEDREELKHTVAALLTKKEISHYLPEGRYGNNNTFSAMGG